MGRGPALLCRMGMREMGHRRVDRSSVVPMMLPHDHDTEEHATISTCFAPSLCAGLAGRFWAGFPRLLMSSAAGCWWLYGSWQGSLARWEPQLGQLIWLCSVSHSSSRLTWACSHGKARCWGRGGVEGKSWRERGTQGLSSSRLGTGKTSLDSGRNGLSVLMGRGAK